MPTPLADTYAWAIACTALGIPFLMLVPMLGAVLVVAAIVLFAFGRFART